MGYSLNRSNATFHHIVKKSDGGKETIENGAVLARPAHEYLHIIEFKDIETYITLNKIFRIINNQGYAPTQEQYRIINYLLLKFEREHKRDLSSKGKLLIKQKYLERLG